MTRHLLIDTDPGIDDALAILLALRSTDARVEAVTTVAGNVAVDAATANARRILAVAAPEPRPPLAGGAAAPLKRALVTAGPVHGQDGLGNLERFVEPDGRPRYPEPAYQVEMRSGPEVILDAADRWGADLTIVALGPLTNVALASSRTRAGWPERVVSWSWAARSRYRAMSHPPPSSISTWIRRRPPRCSTRASRWSWFPST